MDNVLDLLSKACNKVSDDTRLQDILRGVILTPLKNEIASGTMDECIAHALLRVTLPLILLMIVLIVVSVIQIHTLTGLVIPKLNVITQ